MVQGVMSEPSLTMTTEEAVSEAESLFIATEIPGEGWWVIAKDGYRLRPGDDSREAAEEAREIRVMFRALEMIDPCHDWRSYDWHELSGPARDRVTRMIDWRQTCDQAERELSAFSLFGASLLKKTGSI